MIPTVRNGIGPRKLFLIPLRAKLTELAADLSRRIEALTLEIHAKFLGEASA